MAVIEKRGPLQWRARIRRSGFPDLSKTFSNRPDAVRWAADTEDSIRRGTWVDRSSADISFRELAAEYRRDVTPTKRSARSEIYRIERHLLTAPEFARPIGQITGREVAQYRARRLAEPAWRGGKGGGPSDSLCAPQTVLHELRTLSSIFAWAIDDKCVPLENPVKSKRLPKPSASRTRRLSRTLPEEQYLMRAASGSVLLSELIALAIETAMRLGELLALDWSVVDLTRRTVHIKEAKNGEPRSVPLTKLAAATFTSMKAAIEPTTDPVEQASRDENWRRQPRAVRLALIERDKAGRVFHWTRSDSVGNTWRRCIERAQELYRYDCRTASIEPDPSFLADFHFHDLRHEATSRLVEAGISLARVCSVTGHKSIVMLKRYTHLENRDLLDHPHFL